ncbi:MAG: hybrid sensor histidine kinase/response regulator [Bdellovibrionota bacterium]
MPKPPEAQNDRMASLRPSGWSIRTRLIAAGVLLGILALATPFYMRSKLRSLAQTYYWTSANWESLASIHQFGRLLADSESRLRAYATSSNRIWLNNIQKNNLDMDAILSDLWRNAGDSPTRTRLIEESTKTYQQWLFEIARPCMKESSRERLETCAKHLTAEPIAIKLRSLLNEVAKDLHESNTFASRAVLLANRNAILVVTYGGLFFFVGFVILVLSLWYTLIPGLNLLLNASRELKNGNLDYRVSLTGTSETARLAHAFNEMADSLKAQNEKLKELNRMKSDFVSTVSHELRTPLTAIKGSIGLILGNVTGPIPQETAEMLKITEKNTDRLIRLINEILDVAKIEAGAIQMHFDKHSIIEAIGHAVKGIEAMALTHGIELVWEKPTGQEPLVAIDRDRVEQVITNLLSNAIKFTETGGRIEVLCHIELERVVVEVRDTGKGISEEFLERIFEKFQQAESSSHKAKEGTGLGLAIARAIVAEHGGKIWVESKLGQGSRFFFSLPWNGNEYAEAKKHSRSIERYDGEKTLLLVDDEVDFTTVMKKMLEHEGYRIVVANSGKAALELAASEQPDLILLDILMPGMTGFEVQHGLSQNKKTSEIPIAFVSISSELQDLSKLKGSAVAAWPKPIVADDFRVWLKNLLTELSARRNRAA